MDKEVDMSDVQIAGKMERSLEALANGAKVLIEEEQQKLAPDNALIAVLCDTVRLCREVGRYAAALSEIRENARVFQDMFCDPEIDRSFQFLVIQCDQALDG